MCVTAQEVVCVIPHFLCSEALSVEGIRHPACQEVSIIGVSVSGV